VTDLDAIYVQELLRRQNALQAEADRVMRELDLTSLLSQAGLVEQIGSSVSGLMAWRDIDLTVVSPGLTPYQAWLAMRPIVSRDRITQVMYSNETGHLNRSGRPNDDRHYFVIHYETTIQDEWKIDITFWVTDGPRPQRAQALALAQLDREKRLSILSLKDIWHRLPAYPYKVGATDIYAAVLDHGVRTAAEFDAFLIARGMPTREDQAKGG
jgi:GrpB-like predicted nucleotidyltransferase (UPF0157 family)